MQSAGTLDRGTRWLEIAMHLRSRQLTLGALARAMGVTPGHIHRQVGDMLRAGVLQATADKPGRGVEYWLREDLHGLLDAELAAGQPVGKITRGQLGLLIDAIRDLPSVAEVLADPTITAPVVWASGTAAPAEAYLVVLSRSSTPSSVGSLRAALQRAGARCSVVIFDEPMSAEKLRQLAMAWRDAADAAPRGLD